MTPTGLLPRLVFPSFLYCGKFWKSKQIIYPLSFFYVFKNNLFLSGAGSVAAEC